MFRLLNSFQPESIHDSNPKDCFGFPFHPKQLQFGTPMSGCTAHGKTSSNITSIAFGQFYAFLLSSICLRYINIQDDFEL